MKKIKIFGGFGNQIYQYAFAKYIAKLFNEKIELDCSWFSKDHLKDTSRKLYIDRIELKNNFSLNFNQTYIEFLFDLLPLRVSSKLSFLNNYVYENERDFNELIEVISNDKSFFVGFWQDYRFFQGFEEEFFFELMSIFKLNRLMTKPHIGVHVRRGDYVTNSNARKLHGLLDDSYYSEALEILSIDKEDKLCILSDDKEGAVSLISKMHNNIFIDHAASTLQDFINLASCQRIVLANSTFSWWAAWASNMNSKIFSLPKPIIVAPRKWFSSGNNSSLNRYPEDWDIRMI